MVLSYCIFSQYENLGQLCNDPRARAGVLAEMDNVGREAQVML
jgi:long-chain acyl-CoA synthetase